VFNEPLLPGRAVAVVAGKASDALLMKAVGVGDVVEPGWSWP
jgi:hypothetical protein